MFFKSNTDSDPQGPHVALSRVFVLFLERMDVRTNTMCGTNDTHWPGPGGSLTVFKSDS